MPGAIIIVLVLLVFPTLVIIGMLFVAGALGTMLDHDAAVRHEGSELAELNR